MVFSMGCLIFSKTQKKYKGGVRHWGVGEADELFPVGPACNHPHPLNL